MAGQTPNTQVQEKIEEIEIEFFIEEEKVIDTSAGKLVMQRGYIPVTTFSTPTDIIDTIYIKVIRLKLMVPGRWEYVLIDIEKKTPSSLSDFLDAIGLNELEKFEVYNFVGLRGER